MRAPAGSAELVEFARGTAPVINGVLGRLDVTTIPNGLTDVVLEVRDVNGSVTRTKVTVEIVGDQKVGNFSISFEDLNVDAAGIPVSITRTYSTARSSEKLDFGYGWSVDYQNVSVRPNKTLGLDWTLTSSGFIIRTWCLRPNGPHTVAVTLPTGKVERFDMTVSPECQAIIPPQNVTPVFTARAGTRSRLTQDSGVLFVSGTQLLDFSSAGAYDPQTFTLTTEENYVYVLDRNFGIRSIRDPSGNTLTYSANGITHSGGQSVLFQRDAQGRITRITDPAGRALQYTYNANGDLDTVTDRNGQVASHRYNRNHGLVDFSDPRGVVQSRNVYDDAGKLIEQYDAAGNKVAITTEPAAQRQTVRDRRGFPTTLDYDANGNVTRSVDALGGTTSLSYDARGNELSTTDALGRITRRAFDASDRVSSETDALGNATAYAYGGGTQPTAVTDPLGRRTEVDYAASGNPTEVREPTGARTQLAYDTSGNVVSMTNPVGAQIRYTYNAAGQRLSEVDPLGNTTTYAYDANGNETIRRSSRTVGGQVVTMTITRVYDANGNLIQVTDARGDTETTTYNALGKPSEQTDKLGRVTRFEYEARGLLAATVFPDGTREAVEYDANGNETARIDRAGRRTAFEYDALNRQTVTTRPDGTQLRRAYDAAGQVVEEQDARGNRTTFAYDLAGRKTTTTNALSQSVSQAFDAVGNLVSVTDPRGTTTGHQYDAANRKTRTTFADGTFLAYAYDLAGRKVSETDQSGRVTSFAHDAMGRLTTVTDPAGGITRFQYDEVGNRVAQTDPLGRVTRWEYDHEGRPTKRTLPNGSNESFTYDARGNKLTHTTFKGETIVFVYDSNDRQVERRLPNGRRVLTTYAPSGKPFTVSDHRGVTRYQHDVMDRLVQVSNPNGSVLNYAYDLSGNRIEMSVRQGSRPARVTRYEYDALNRLERVVDPEGGVTAYTYDANGNRAGALLPNGTRAAYSYDQLNRVTLVEHRRTADDALLARFAYSVAPNGQRVRADETLNGATRSVEYTYDAYMRLTREIATGVAAQDATFEYDAVGNRVAKTSGGQRTEYTYDVNDRLLSQSQGGQVIDFDYDPAGNLIQARQGAAVVASYEWDAEGRLIGVSKGGQTVSYTYDAFGHRVGKSVGGVTSHYTVDVNREFAEVVEERNDAGDLVVGYVHGDDLIKQLRGGQSTYYHADGLGSVRALSGPSATISDTWHYEAFGGEIERTGTTLNEYQFTGEQIDANTGFYYLRARWMDPEVGRFLGQDPHPGLMFQPRTLHKYSYVYSDPVNLVDPSGEFGIAGFFSGFLSFSIRTLSLSFYATQYVFQRIGASMLALAVQRFGAGAYRLIGLSPALLRLDAGKLFERLINPAMRLLGALPQQRLLNGRAIADWVTRSGNIVDAKLGQAINMRQLAVFAEWASANGGQITYITLTRTPTALVNQATAVAARYGVDVKFVWLLP
jgi:RHS repeat-associated protein